MVTRLLIQEMATHLPIYLEVAPLPTYSEGDRLRSTSFGIMYLLIYLATYLEGDDHPHTYLLGGGTSTHPF